MSIVHPSIGTYARAFFLAMAMLAPCAAVPPLYAHDADVVVVKSADLKPYQEVLRGFKNACDCDVRDVKLKTEEGVEEVLLESPSVVVAIGTSVFKKVRTIKDLPIVYTMVMPSDLSLSLGPNISGVSMDLAPTSVLASLIEVFPHAKRIGLIYDPRQTGPYVSEAIHAARAANIELVSRQAQDPSGISAALNEMQGTIDVFWMLPDPTVATIETVELLLRFSFENSVPLFSFSKKYVEMGAVASLDVDPYDMGAQAGELVKKLSAGAPGPIRVYARTPHLFINQGVADKMGLKIKDEVLKKGKRIE